MTDEQIKEKVTDKLNKLLITLKEESSDFADEVKRTLEEAITTIDEYTEDDDYYDSDDYYGSNC